MSCRRVLECCKQQDELSRRIGASDNHENHMKRILAEDQLAVECYPTFRLFSETAAGLDEDYNFVGIPMRSDILENVIVENPGWSGKGGVYFEIGYRAYSEITCTKRDGSSFKKEYREFLDSVAPKNVRYDDLKTMIQEEAEPFFAGQKDAATVAEIIQNRIQIYLEE